MTGPSPLASALSDLDRIECEVGAGGMVTVYLAFDLDQPLRPLGEGARLALSRLAAEQGCGRSPIAFSVRSIEPRVPAVSWGLSDSRHHPRCIYKEPRRGRME